MSQANRKKRSIKTFLPYIIIAALMAVLLLITLILHLVQVRPLDPFMDFDRVFVMNSFNDSTRSFEGKTSAVNEGFDAVSHSVLRGWFDSTANGHRVLPRTFINTETGEEQRTQPHNTTTILNIAPRDGEFMFRLEWNQVQRDFDRFYEYVPCREYEGEYIRQTIWFDTLILIIPAPSPDFERVRMFPYMRDNIENGRPFVIGEGFSWRDENGIMSSAAYEIHEFGAYMYTRGLHRLLLNNPNFAPSGGM